MSPPTHHTSTRTAHPTRRGAARRPGRLLTLSMALAVTLSLAAVSFEARATDSASQTTVAVVQGTYTRDGGDASMLFGAVGGALGADGLTGQWASLSFEGLDDFIDRPCTGQGSGQAGTANGLLEIFDAEIVIDLTAAFHISGKWRDGAGGTGIVLIEGRPDLYQSLAPGLGYCGASIYGHVDMLGMMVLAPDGEDAPDVSDLLDLVDVVPGDFKESDLCERNGGDRMVDATNLGVRTFVYTYQPAVDQLWVCARVEDTTTGEGYGGRLEATPTHASPSVSGPGAPSTDGDSAACTLTTDPPNEVPGPHPISSGGVATVDYMLDAYVNDSQAWLCVQVGTSDYRVKVPLGAGNSGVSAGTAARWYSDPGTPS